MAKSLLREQQSADLEEEVYWAAVAELERLSPDQLKKWPSVKAEKLQLDVYTGGVDTLEGWIDSLKQRNRCR